VSETRRLDVLGSFCPVPILLAAREMQCMEPGDLLELLGDDPAMLEDVPEWCERAGHRLHRYEVQDDGSLLFFVEKGTRPARRESDGEPAEP